MFRKHIPHCETWKDFYGRWLSVAFVHPWSCVDSIATGLGLLIPLVLRIFPNIKESKLSPLGWEIPLGALAALATVRFVLAPYWIYQDRHSGAKETERLLREELERERHRQSKPNIRARIQQVRVIHSLGSRLVGQLLGEIGKRSGRSFEGQPVDVYVQLYLTNETLNAPVAIRDYQLVVTKGEKQVRGDRFAHIEGETLEFEVEEFDGHGFRETRRERKTLAPDLAAEINRGLVEYGAPKVGWLRFSCKDIEPKDVTLDSISLIVVDAFDGPHHATVEPGALLEIEEQGL